MDPKFEDVYIANRGQGQAKNISLPFSLFRLSTAKRYG